VVRGALLPSLQRQLVIDALTLFPEPPNHTNHLKAYPGGLPGIWKAAQQGLRLQHAAQQQAQQAASAGGAEAMPGGPQLLPSAAASCSSDEVWGAEGSGPTAASLLRRLRWATLGPPYDWTQRLYLRNVPHMPLPAPLRQLAVALADLAAQLLGGSGSRCCEDPQGYCPDAALLNYYHEGAPLPAWLPGRLAMLCLCCCPPLRALGYNTADALFLTQPPLTRPACRRHLEWAR
jgi:alkylated DNA repair dioxygenase AlkB